MSSLLHLHTPHGDRSLCADEVADPRGVADLLARHGLALNTRCCGRGGCKGCALVLESGELRDAATGAPIVAPAEFLACRAEWIDGVEAVLTVPGRALLAHKPSVAEDFEIKVPIGNDPLFAGEYGLAVDIGTTTVVVLLAELATGKILGRASAFNAQIRLGDDVLSRIQQCTAAPAMVTQFQDAVCRETLLPLARTVCAHAEVPMEQVSGMAVAGNSTMLHLLFGVDPSPMGVAPFTPRFLEQRVQPAASLGLCGFRDGMPVHALPGLAAYVGADLAAGIFATGLAFETQPVLLVDVGTNGEIVLARDGRLIGCATAAGPAFEGSGLTSGMRAAEGAIERLALSQSAAGIVRVDGKTIGNHPLAAAPGICGSAYIDFLAQARACGVLLESGRFDPETAKANPAFFRDGDHGRVLHLCGGENAARISEPDIALLLQAKAAIAAGIETLLEREGLTPGGVSRVYLAGGFGLHLEIAHAIACGLLPGFATGQVEAVGNTSLAGAYLAMLDRTVLDELERVRACAEIVELNLDPGFEDRYIDHLCLPGEAG